jgi:inosine/xanthosine triphosphate pyrophosphatase family protein
MDPHEKDALSHRGKALAKFREKLEKLLNRLPS